MYIYNVHFTNMYVIYTCTHSQELCFRASHETHFFLSLFLSHDIQSMRAYIHTYVSIYICMNIHTYTCVRVCMYMHRDIHMYIYMHCIHAHT